MGIGKKLLEQYPWGALNRIRNMPGCFAAGIPDGFRFIYRPRRGVYLIRSGITVNDLTPGVPYTAFYFDPATGRRFDLGVLTPPSAS